MNLDALIIPRDRLLSALQERVQQRAEARASRDAELGADRIRVTSYMENIGWPELFGFDMNACFADPDLSLEMQLREKIFWADNSLDDSEIGFDIQATTGMYFDMTLFGQTITHTKDGVPEFHPHPLAADPRPSAIPPFDFYTTGDMPALLSHYERMREISSQEYGGQLTVQFPHFHRGPLDIYVQMRGYENFVADTLENPQRITECLSFFIDERLRFARERQRFLSEGSLPPSTFVADDWVNIPFISPDIFHHLVVPAYHRIRSHEGPVTGFHTCGKMEPIVGSLLQVFPDIRRIEVNGWNNLLVLDEIVPVEIGFDISLINTFVMSASVEEQRAKLAAVAAVSRHRKVTLCAQAMVKFHSYEETLSRMNRFIELARRVCASEQP